jgi:hypothetical protein
MCCVLADPPVPVYGVFFISGPTPSPVTSVYLPSSPSPPPPRPPPAPPEKTTRQVRKQYEGLRKSRLDEFMAGFNTISLRLKEMYQMITLGERPGRVVSLTGWGGWAAACRHHHRTGWVGRLRGRGAARRSRAGHAAPRAGHPPRVPRRAVCALPVWLGGDAELELVDSLDPFSEVSHRPARLLLLPLLLLLHAVMVCGNCAAGSGMAPAPLA